MAEIEIDQPQELEVAVAGPGTVNRMFIYTGTVKCDFWGESGRTVRDSITFLVGRDFTQGQVHRAIATGSLASILNKHVANNALWAIDSIVADWDDDSGRIKVTAQLAVADDGVILRFGYQVTVLAEL